MIMYQWGHNVYIASTLHSSLQRNERERVVLNWESVVFTCSLHWTLLEWVHANGNSISVFTNNSRVGCGFSSSVNCGQASQLRASGVLELSQSGPIINSTMVLTPINCTSSLRSVVATYIAI